MIAVVDRIEGETAVLEICGNTYDWPLAALPTGVVEGDRLETRFERVSGDTDAARERLERLRARTPDDDDLIDI